MNSNAAMRSRGGGLWEGLYRVLMRRNSVYVTFVVAGAFVGERVRFHHLFLYFLCGLRIVDYGVRNLWDYNNAGIAFN
ncbi:hypothetical protein OPV22_011656 [Ensete ventricosum]|uniref:Complex III subunit 9 n=1 Tax=Ensete ventricosum TaxID=4639 RepID=A0AAV8RM00_ENSVE|nr:hypothetical protein OPV22_011656 [Ensete ventricosum]